MNILELKTTKSKWTKQNEDKRGKSVVSELKDRFVEKNHHHHHHTEQHE